MKNLNQFKQGIKEYKYLEMIKCSFPNSLKGIKREIAHVDTVQFSLWTDRDGEKRKSYMYFPKAKDYVYNEENETFTFRDGQDYFTYKLYK